MRRLVAVLLMVAIVLASGCIGSGVGLTEEKVLNAVQGIDTAKYAQNFSMSMYFIEPHTNRTVNLTVLGHVTGVFNRTAKAEIGNMSMRVHASGMNITLNWPYFINGSTAYFKIDGRWYRAEQDNLYTEASGSLNIKYIENLLKTKNVTIEKLADGYAFRVNVTFWEYVKATNQTSYLRDKWGNESRVNVTTRSGWVEVHLRKDGTPTFIETYMNLVLAISGLNGEEIDVHMVIHNSVSLSDINGHVEINAPEGINKAKNLEEALW
ncbi:hypothetical protein [Thermococcus sp.]|uniref:hypothetical protein n=1 Tax=Thermococcus sp. TaxID=35749 RepID=UPI0026239E21|nr:hypothetical protein [Thermococcus sp.]